MFKSIIFKFIIPYLIGLVIYLEGINFYTSATLVALFLIYLYKRQNINYFLLFLILGLYIGYTSFNFYNDRFLKLKDSNTFKGIVLKLSIDKRNCIIKERDCKLYLYFDKSAEINVGDEIVVYGEIIKDIDMKKVYSRNLNAYVKSNKYKVIGKKSGFIIYIYKIHDKLKREMYKIDKISGPFISGLVTGDIDGIDSEIKSLLNDLNISHIVVVSGAHLGILALFVMIVFAFNFKLRYIFLLLFTTCYVILANFNPSAVRAYIMLLLTVFAQTLKKYPNKINILFTATFMMIAYNAFLIYDLGFILSISSTFGIILLSPIISTKLSNKLSVPISAFLFTLPIVLYINGRFSLISIPINMLIAGLVSILTITSLISVLLYILFNYNPLLLPILFCGRLLVNLLKIIQKFNIEFFVGNFNLILVIIYYVFILTLFNIIRTNRISKYAISIVLFILVFFNFNFKHELTINFIDVGQGDCIFIETPNKKTILIDTGAKFEGYNMAEKRVVPYIKRRGYNKIDVFIITHFHNDHAGGIEYILKNLNVKNKYAFMPNRDDFLDLKNRDKIIIDNVELNVITNEKAMNMESNEKCIVLSCKYKEFDFLLTADADLNLMTNISGEYEILKMPHHGSKYSFNEKVLEKLKTQTCIFTVGRNNFGHPSKEVIDLLEKNNIKYYRTDLDGNIQVTSNGKKYKIITQK
ncbi:DNA internalization-related competence protein ComEC/Rec2 [Thermobrachium celere]|uniref:Late competence protein ComEC, DNA transport n=1 Tax=Thermobrachium celere DSM 8682 TaxID=941824 RepID=R7RPI7_9CLOT|nr:DNA internalization-related competence protein ComEC/Rec2 [Thermobrachium celere]CDF58087.1 Late competence protein ComEC, DNA transport [Thermobrachium celere DSM 8682]